MAKYRLKPRKPPDFGSNFRADRDTVPLSAREAAEQEDAASSDRDSLAHAQKLNKYMEEYFGTSDAPPKPTSKRTKAAAVAPPTPPAGRRRHVALLDGDMPSKKKGKSKLVELTGERRIKMVDKLFVGFAEETRKRTGHSGVKVIDNTNALIVGIPCPSLAFEFLIAQDCFPLGLVYQLVGKTGVGKSALAAEIGRWFVLAGGGMILCEAETKFNPLWYQSIMGFDTFEARVKPMPCDSVEHWQRSLTWAINAMKDQLRGTTDAPGPGRTVPIQYTVDSIMGKQSEETIEKIFGAKGKTGKRGTTGEGHASRGYPIEAQLITRYMRSVPGELENWPFSLILVNHLKLKTDDMGNAERHKPGGDQVGFQESFEIELRKVGGHKKRIECKEFEGYPVELSCEKNSFGPTHRRIQSRVLWWEEEDPETGLWRQKTVWDWDWSTVHLLYHIMYGEKSSPRLKASLKEIDFHLECPKASEIENLAWSRSLGMKKDDAVSWAELGALIREDKELRDKLREALRINRRPLLQGDYLKQLDAASEALPEE